MAREMYMRIMYIIRHNKCRGHEIGAAAASMARMRSVSCSLLQALSRLVAAMSAIDGIHHQGAWRQGVGIREMIIK